MAHRRQIVGLVRSAEFQLGGTSWSLTGTVEEDCFCIGRRWVGLQLSSQWSLIRTCPNWQIAKSPSENEVTGCPYGSTTIRLRTFRLRHFIYRHFVYRHFVYYCIPVCRAVIHPTSVSANHYFHQFQLLLTLWFDFINPASTDTMLIQYIQLASIASWQSSLFFQLKTLIFINPTSS